MKQCSHCKELKDINEFNKNKRMQDGLSHYCKTCKHESDKKSWRENREKRLEYLHKWYQNNKEYVREQGKKYMQRPEVKERQRLRSIEYRKNNPEKRIESQRKYSEKNRERINQKSRDYRKKYPEKRRTISKKWRENNREYGKRYREMNIEKIKQGQKEYRLSEHGKKIIRAYIQSERGKQAKARKDAKRYRNLNWVPLWDNPFPDDIPVDYHHHTDFFVIPMPRVMHRFDLSKKHRDECKKMIEKLYSIDIDKIICDRNS